MKYDITAVPIHCEIITIIAIKCKSAIYIFPTEKKIDVCYLTIPKTNFRQ